MSHSSWCTSAEAIRSEVFLNSQSRVFQFASYAFDVSIADMLLTLLVGGCICVPSDQDRQSNLTGVINSLRVNWACLTPSVARILDPAKVVSIKTLALAGEAIAPGDIIKWKPHVRYVISLRIFFLLKITLCQDILRSFLNFCTIVDRWLFGLAYSICTDPLNVPSRLQ